MAATVVLLAAIIAFFEAISRLGTPREARRRLRELSVREHLIAAWAGVVLFTRTYERHQAHAHAGEREQDGRRLDAPPGVDAAIRQLDDGRDP